MIFVGLKSPAAALINVAVTKVSVSEERGTYGLQILQNPECWCMNVAGEGLDDCEVVELQQRAQRGQPGLCDAAPTDGCRDLTGIFGILSVFFF